ncbi:ATPase [Acrocarpospora corrugata]|uniref:ATPase n=1 Tax=Acrocarpospora corrugata TaxID=35763 RepID=A0A5M3VWN5_9ACTN|nr:SRPBCC family protein [Acrocarpospora corrugata]GES00906.1 ATPase [Acrocarpospora corrugata]
MSDTAFVIEPGRQDIVMTRVFDAPRELVFRVITDPELLPRWWGPRSLTTRVDRMEVRPGGHWRCLNIDTDGIEYAFGGVYHDIVAPERFVRTWAFEGAPADVALETVTLVETEGRTTYIAQSVHQSVEARDAIVRADGARGGRESMDRLAEVLATR